MSKARHDRNCLSKGCLSVLVVASFALGGVAGCEKSGSARLAGAGEMPERVGLAPAAAEIGTYLGSLRHTAAFSFLEVTKHPITVRRYRQCVEAGVCSAPEDKHLRCGVTAPSAPDTSPLTGPTYDLPQGDELPVTCTTPRQAEQYCAWLGGRLPTSDEWFAATRGPVVRRFAWGDDDPTCARHPSACVAETRPDYAVGRRPGGAGPTGIEDVLLTETELVAGTPSASGLHCPAGAHCQIGPLTGHASIDGLWVVPETGLAGGGTNASTPFGFRCAFTEVGR